MSAVFETLKSQRKGAFLEELDEKMRDLVTAVSDQRKAGELTIKLKLKPLKKGIEDSTLTLEDDIILKAPKEDKKASVFFATDEGTLSRKDPNQMEMDLKVIKDDQNQESKASNE